ncbi:MAG: alpha/beta fold hydrolase [Planctomycetes bacterium]|nr:alpha/beta fold hydrolase [Planctomycetota bacterium]
MDSMSKREAVHTFLELRESDEHGEVGAGLSHKSEGLVLFHVAEVAADGEPRGVVTIVHDAGEHGSRYQRLAEVLADRGWAVALPDLRGHGKSEGERGHSAGLREVMRDLDEVQNHLAYRLPDAPKVLLGVGLGAAFAASYVEEGPGRIAALALVAPVFEPPFVEPAAKRGLSRFFGKEQPTDAGETGYTADSISVDRDVAAAWSADSLNHTTLTRRAAAEARRAIAEHLANAIRIDVPSLVLQGTHDALGSPERIESWKQQGAKVVTFDGAGHSLFHEACAADACKQVADWLDATLQ